MPVYDFEDWVAWVEANDHDFWKKVLSTDIRKVDIFLRDHYELYINGKRKESLFLIRWRQPYIKINEYLFAYSNYVNLILGDGLTGMVEDLAFVSTNYGLKAFSHVKIKNWCLISAEKLPRSYLVEEGWCKILPFDDRQSIKLSEIRACITPEIMNKSLTIMYS